MSDPQSAAVNGGTGGDCALLTAEYQELADAKLIGRALREQWDIPPEKRPVIVERLIGIVEKTEVPTPCGESGLLHLEGPADKNAIAAARVLVAMVGQNIGESAEQPQKPLTLNIFNGDSIFMPPEQRRTVLISVMGHAPESLDAAAEKGVVESTAHPPGNGNAAGPVPAESGKILPASTVAKANGHAGPGQH